MVDWHWRITVIGAVAIVAAGCRPKEPARFTPSAEVAALTDDIDDPEELKIYEGLQDQIGERLRERCGEPATLSLLGDEAGNADRLQRGHALYVHYCIQCHGVNGDGQGAIAAHLTPKPRDYTRGIFKFVSTSNGKPRRADLIRTLRQGVSGTSMPSFATLSNDELGDLADYVIALAQRGELQRQLAQIAYDEEALPEEDELDQTIEDLLTPWREANGSVVMPLTPMTPMTAESVAAGQALFLKFACSRCHGTDGRGGTLGNVDVGADVWGQKAPAADLTSGMFRGGGRPIDVYRRIYAGINGTPMPAFANQFQENPDDIWQLVHFVKETGERRRRRLPPPEAPSAPTAAPSDEPRKTDENNEEEKRDAVSGADAPTDAANSTSSSDSTDQHSET